MGVVNFASGDVTMFVNTTATPGAAPTFEAGTSNSIGGFGSARNTTAAADFDNSGTLDLAVPTFTDNRVAVLDGNGEGLLLTPTLFGAGNGSEQAATGDLNGDFKPDIVTANFFSGDMSALLNTTVVPTLSFAPKVDTTTGDGARALAIGNLNGDPDGDVAVVNNDDQNLSVLLGEGDGTFQAPVVNYPIGGTSTSGVAIGDLEADGKQDIVVSRSAGVGVFRGNGNGTFQPVAGLTGSPPSDVEIADVNNDSKPDIVTDNQVFLNTTATGGGGGGGGVLGASAQSELPKPEVRKNVNVTAVKGVVKIKQPGQSSFRTLKGEDQIPMGSLIDATKGRVRLTSAAGSGKTQTAEFYDGLFKVTQTKGKRPITDLTLAGKLAGCAKGKPSAAAKKRKGRRLWGSGKGRFRTRGKRSSALVRGTIWLVEDRCNGTTFTRVRKGVVQVRDFGKRRNFTVRAGRTYTAKPRRR